MSRKYGQSSYILSVHLRRCLFQKSSIVYSLVWSNLIHLSHYGFTA